MSVHKTQIKRRCGDIKPLLYYVLIFEYFLFRSDYRLIGFFHISQTINKHQGEILKVPFHIIRIHLQMLNE